MRLFLISQTVNRGWDTYDSAVVCAENEQAARETHPSTTAPPKWWEDELQCYTWCQPKDVQVKEVGLPIDPFTPGVICSSFNAG